jgi:tRNA G10  N-methylase Trm11
MNLYGFILGTNHSLCKVEICTVLKTKNIDFEIVEASEEILIIKTKEELDLNINDFGSTAKLVKFYDKLDDIVIEQANNIKSVTFGISIINGGGKFKQLNELYYSSNSIGREVMNLFREYGIKSGFLPIKERSLSTVSVNENLLKEKGFELILVSAKNKTYYGKTLSVQDYEGYSKRDFGRPERDDKSGMVPPKIAKMMINLARQEKTAKLLDPFCGSGTFLQEEILLGYKNVEGSDLDIKAVERTKKNLGWIFPDKNISVSSIDVLKLSSRFKQVDAIITEPFLGSERLHVMSRDQVFRERQKLELFYTDFFAELKKVLKENGIIVIIFPVIRYKNEFLYLDILDKIEKLGLIKQNYCEKDRELGLNLSDRKTIVYYRPKQTVSREIIIFSNVAP